MYSSLYTRLKSLVEDKATGVMLVNYKYGGQGKLYLENGEFVGCEVGNTRGVDAAKKLSRWLSFNSRFIEDMLVQRSNQAGFSTQDFLGHLGKVKNWVEKVQKVVPQNSARFKMHVNGSKNSVKLKPAQLKVALALDGNKTITQLVSELKISEFDVLNTIFHLSELGIAEMIGAHRPMENAQREAFLASLKEILSDIIGPAAEVIIDDAFETINSEEKYLARREIPDLIRAIAMHLDPDEKTVFSDWWNNHSELK